MTEAEAAIRERIAREGSITFRDFMEMALYSAPGSYYGTVGERIGSRGDYFTSPEVHPAFGALLAHQLEQVWVAMGRPGAFTAVEMGAGTGALARDVLAYASRFSPAFHDALRYALVERSPAMVSCSSRLRGSATGAAVLSEASLGEGSIEGCFLSNELPDAFPVHRVEVVGGALREIHVRVRDGRLEETLEEPSTPELASYFERLGFLPPEGCRAEVNLGSLDWIALVGRALRRGAVLTLDYGYPAEDLYSPRRRDGTLLCFYRHTLNDDPYARIGQQDVTTHVDFTSLSREGLKHGLHPLGLVSQRDFLSALGMGGFLAALPRMGLRLRDYEANRLAMLELLKPEGLGRVKALVQQKGLEGFDAAGLRPGGLRPEDLGRGFSSEPPPLLTPSHLRLNAVPSTESMIDAGTMWRELVGEDDEEDET